MLPIIDPSAQQFLNSVNQVQTRLERAQREIASGLKITKASDAPDQVSGILQLQADIRRNQDVKDGVSRVKTEVDTGEETLSACVDLMDQAVVIATQATGTEQTTDTRATLAANVQALMEQMVANSRVTVDGHYVFSGDLDQTPSYQMNLANDNGVDRLQLATATKQVQGTGSATFDVGRSANDIFDHRDANDNPASDNVFAALNGLRLALLADDTTAIKASVAAIQESSRTLNNELSFYGLAQDRISNTLDRSSSIDVQLRAELGVRRDADAVASILELNQGQVQLQAALQARAKMTQQSLFELL
jgi:flagellar hook-associated protein 3 FlgL